MEINKINGVNNYKAYQNAGFKVPDNADILKSYAPVKPKKVINKPVLAVISALAALGIAVFALYKKNDLIGQIKKSMELELGEKVERRALSCVVNKKQLMKMLAGLSEENYVASKENIEKGIFRADLHSHTWFSDGWGRVEDIMNEAAEYADKLHSKTGKKFLFSITDHDGVEGAKEALRLIVKNPQKYKNLAFVPGVEMSFVQQIEGDKFEGAEVLAHCINPYSEILNAFLDNLHFSRERMINNMIDGANRQFGEKCFSREEMGEYYLKRPNENFAYNLHYRVLNYLQVKNLINKMARENNLDANQLYLQYMKQWKTGKNFKSVDNFIEFLKQNGTLAQKPADNDSIFELCKSSFPKIEDNRVVAPAESTFEDLIGLFSEDKNAVLGFAHPVFTFKSFKNRESAIADLISKSKKLIKTTEKYHQAYYYPIKNGVISQKDVTEINGIIDKYGLTDLGGRDNHSAHLMDRG